MKVSALAAREVSDLTSQTRTARLAAVQAAPEFLDRDGSVAKACRLIRAAGAQGAQIIGFPEGFIPAHPLWYEFHAATSPSALAMAERLFHNAVEIPSPATDDLCRAAAAAGAFVVMGVCERERGRIGTMYNTLLFIDGQGRLLGRHRKLMPTLGERLVHARGDTLGLRTYPSAGGQVSGLICGENSNALATFVLDAQGSNFHVAAWPSHFNIGLNMREIIPMVTRALAYQMKAYIINAIGEVSAVMHRDLALTDEHRAFLATQSGGACIIGPWGQIVAGPLPPGEGILYADVELDAMVQPKIVQDFGGHYNRFDLLEVRVHLGIYPNLRHDSGVADPDRRADQSEAPRRQPAEAPGS